MKILIVGAGNMGRTYAEGFLHNHLLTKDDLLILEKLPERAEQLRQEGYAQVMYEPQPSILHADILMLAVKPQDLPPLLPKLRPFLRPDHLVLSIMAGIQIRTLTEGLGIPKVIRAMPNLPAQIGMGMTGFTAAPEVDKRELFIIQNLINTTGKSIYFEQESQLDAVTAISGSGPAYVFFFMEAMMASARQMGFTASEAELLVEQTFLGAVNLVRGSRFSCAEWIEKVASRGGTTEAALQVFAQTELHQHIGQGTEAARQRAEVLGK